MKKVHCATLLCALLVAAVVVLAEVEETEAVTCNAMELSVCAGAFTLSQPPSKDCCDKLRKQKPCLCGYIKNPSLRQFVNSPNAKNVASTCRVPYPTC